MINFFRVNFAYLITNYNIKINKIIETKYI